MDQTISIGIVSAVAALSGSALTAWISIRNARLQNEYALSMAREDRAERRINDHRTARREAYVAFLTAVTTAAIEVVRAEEPDLTDDEFEKRWTEAWMANRRTLGPHCVLAVEGPEAVVGPATYLRQCLFDELRIAKEVRRGVKPVAALSAASEERRRATAEMSNVAREANGGNIQTS
ncbi:hypothetical protein [Actinacidiphila glaucinigra]|uniref:hypothetical protein n=1 Tax=Actinacidiphila glaucinigra TaxID=235986 RepID=UPI003D93EAB7